MDELFKFWTGDLLSRTNLEKMIKSADMDPVRILNILAGRIELSKYPI